MEHCLQVDDTAAGPGPEELDGLPQIHGQGNIRQDSEIGRGEEVQTGLALDPPQLAICVDNSVSWAARAAA